MGISPMYPNKPVVKFFNIKEASLDSSNGAHINTIVGLSSGENGVRVDSIKLQSVGNNEPTKLCIHYCYGPNMMLPENNFKIKEITLPKTTISNTSVLTKVDDILLNIVLPKNSHLLFSLVTPIESGWNISVFGAEY